MMEYYIAYILTFYFHKKIWNFKINFLLAFNMPSMYIIILEQMYFVVDLKMQHFNIIV